MGAPQTMSCKKVLITGSEGLIGKKLKEALEHKYEVVGLDIKNDHDLTDEYFVKDWFKNNKLDSMILCHAYNPIPFENSIKKEPHDEELDSIRKYLEVNVTSVFNLCCNFVKNNDSGSVINVSSVYGVGSPKHHIYNKFTKPIGYSLSKSSIILMTKYLACYYAPKYRFKHCSVGRSI